MLQEFLSYTKANKLIPENYSILLAVSGGADSMVMLNLFVKARYKIAIAHCNFQLRDKESDSEESLVRAIAVKHKLPFFVKRFNTTEYLEEHHLSVQEAARILRYQWFSELLQKEKYDLVATAHHANDNLETFFINLGRGTGISGLKGIPVKNNHIIRPLLFATKTEILKYAKANKLKYCIDSSNLKDDYLRNNIRLNIIPAIEKNLKGFETAAIKSVQHLYNDHSLFIQLLQNVIDSAGIIEKKKNELKIHLDRIPFEFEVFLHHLLKDHGINETQLQNICSAYQKKVSGKRFETADKEFFLNRSELVIIPKTKEEVAAIYEITSLKNIPTGLPLKLTFSQGKKTDKLSIGKDPDSEYFDFNTIQFPLILRKWQKGDKLKPLGMKGFKKVSDLLSEKKLSLFEKKQVWVLCSNQRIFWIIGLRIDNDFAVTEKTKQTLRITYSF